MSLIAQHETDLCGQWHFGVELFHDPAEGFYTARFHARVYDGLQVTSSHATPEVRLAADTKDAAWREASEIFAQFRSLYGGAA